MLMEMEGRTSLSPSKLNKELNKILETERMIKEYKEMITKMQRDLYSKKTTEPSKPLPKEPEPLRSPASLLSKRKVYQEDVNPTETIQQMIRKNQIQTYVDLGSRNKTQVRYKTEENSHNQSSSVVNYIEIYDPKEHNDRQAKASTPLKQPPQFKQIQEIS